ncbi:MAG TPA: cysteine desulfurase family protein [Acidimicrobiales bacterium]|nr:cysteine desulfurase family protein [Acidimicrobiales bacterium]
MRHYLDHASTSPTRPEAIEAMVEWMRSPLAADPARVHTEGHAARVVVEDARDAVAELLGARNREVVFTSGATESIAAATWGAAERGAHMVASDVEHSAVRLAASADATVTWVGCDRLGRVDVAAVEAAITRDTALVHLQWGNHEVGTIQPVAEVAAVCRDRRVLFHVDAAQAAGHVSIAFDDLGADLLSVSAHKMGGPPGVGALVVRRGLRLRPLLLGGDQERARRAGFENVPAIVGWGAVARTLLERQADEERAARVLTQRIIERAPCIDGVTVYGDPTNRLPHIVCLGVAGVEPQGALLGLDQAGIAVHSGSSCASEAIEPSPVLAAMGVDADRSLRVSVGWSTTDADIDAFLVALPDVLGRLRALGQSPQ